MKEKTNTLIALMISILAVILSQFRPIYTLFDTPEIKIKYASTVTINHYYGFLKIRAFLSFENTGKSPGSLEKLFMYIRRKDDPSCNFILKGDNYIYLNPNLFGGDIIFPLNNIPLRDEEIFGNYILFSENIPRENYELIEKTRLLRSEQLDNYNFIEIKSNKNNKAQINDRLFNVISEMSNRVIDKLRLGEYYILFINYQGNSSKVILSSYSFTFYDYDITRLNNITNDYKSNIEQNSYLVSKGYDIPIFQVNDNSITHILFNEFNSYSNDLIK